MTHHSLGVHKEEVLLGGVLHPGQDVLAPCALGLSDQEVPILWEGKSATFRWVWKRGRSTYRQSGQEVSDT